MPKDQGGAASSITVSICNLLGYIPAPYLYGLVKDLGKNEKSQLPMTICMYYSFFGFVWMLFSAIFRIREFKEKDVKQLEEQTPIQNTENNNKNTVIETILKGRSTVSFGMLYNNKFDVLENMPIDYSRQAAVILMMKIRITLYLKKNSKKSR